MATQSSVNPFLLLVLISTLLGKGSAATPWNAAVEENCAPYELRVDCHPEPNASEATCLERGCAWCISGSNAPEGTPWCYTRPNHGYKMVGTPYETARGYRVNLTKNTEGSYFGGDFNDIFADFEFWENTHLRIKVYPRGVERYEVPLKLEVDPPASPAKEPLYKLSFINEPAFAFQVIRKSSGEVLFDTGSGGLSFADQFIQLSTKLPSKNVYGIGENEQASFKHQFQKYDKFGLWARDHPPEGNTNIYGVQPLYTVIESDGSAHSVMILNSNAMEFVMMPGPGLTYRTIGGLLDLHFFLGPTPENTVQQFTKVVGRAYIPPYWALGFHLCRWGYNHINQMKAAVDRTAKYGIPHDVQYGDIDIMDRALDFTIDPVNFAGLSEYVLELKERGIKFVTILDPGISPEQPAGSYRPFDLGNELDVWIRRPDGTPSVGRVWPGLTYFPDYSKNSTRTWWITLIKEFKNLIDFDGLWIDMNEPASWSVGDIEQGCDSSNKYNNPPYVPGIKGLNLAEQTLCPDALQEFGVHYNTHSLYGWSESEPTLAAVQEALGKRGTVLTRSTFLGVGKWAAHWLGDNFSRWSNLHYSIIGMLSFNMYGVPFVGADICGFNENTTPEMCLRWQQLGAFYPFSRNHNGINNMDQDPGYFGEEVAKATRESLLVRYTFLPYLNTQFFHHATEGSTVVRSLGFEFPTDTDALNVDTQFLWGKGFLVSPALKEGQRSVEAYFPDAPWYNYFTGAKLAVRKEFMTLATPLEAFNIHLRGGIIFPTQEPSINAVLSRMNPFGLIVALDDAGSANGELYVDDGDSIDPQVNGNYFHLQFDAANQVCTSKVLQSGYDLSGQFISTVRLLGAGRVDRVTVNGVEHDGIINNPGTGEVIIDGLKIMISQPFQIEWYKD